VSEYERARVRAIAAGQEAWGAWGSATEHQRHMWRITGRGGRCRCDCGCGGRATHSGGANGLALMGGCELSVRRWVRDGYQPEATS